MERARLTLLLAGSFFILSGIISFLVDVPNMLRFLALLCGAACTIFAVWMME